jgi:hypothetical protein
VPIRFRKSVPTAWLEITIREGMNRQVRRMTASVGHPTVRLVRVAVGPIELGELLPGRWRDLTGREIERITGAAKQGGWGRTLPGAASRSEMRRSCDSAARARRMPSKGGPGGA